MKKNEWEPEEVLKGRMAECLVSELLKNKECKNKVYRFGYETVLQNLTQLEQTFDKYTETPDIIRSIPDLVVVSPHGKPFFVEVKYRADKRFQNWDKLRNVLNYWNAVMILVSSNKKPYFQVAYTLNTKNYKFIPIEDFKEFNVNKEVLKQFNNLIERYYFNK